MATPIPRVIMDCKFKDGDIKVFDGNGKLKKIIPIKEAMEASDQRFRAQKSSFAGSPRIVGEVRKELNRLDKIGRFE